MIASWGFSGLYCLSLAALVLIPRASRTSSTQVTGIAPCLIKLLGPWLMGLSILPGMAITVLFCSKANWAVMRVPLFSVHSIIKTASLIPLWIRFLATKFWRKYSEPSGYSLMKVPPFSRILSASFRFETG